MENRTNYRIAYHGTGMDLFRIEIVNLILCMVTLGFYYPWAKAKTLQYLYSQTLFEEQPFVFSGTGQEMFKGFVKAFALIAILWAGVFISLWYGGEIIQLTLLLFYLIIIAMIPLIIHGSYKYRMAKSSWRGIRFGYTGERSELIKIFYRDLFLTIITFGIYGSWLAMNIRRYVLDHVRIGNATFTYHGNGGDFFLLNLKGYFLTLFTLGIYMFWWQKDLFEYFVNNLRLRQGDHKVAFRSKATGGGFAGLLIVNLLIVIFTLGFGYAWAVTRTLNYVANNIDIYGDLSFDELVQSQSDYSDATADDMADFFDFGFII